MCVTVLGCVVLGLTKAAINSFALQANIPVEPLAVTEWRQVQNAIKNCKSGSLQYSAHLGHPAEFPEVKVSARWHGEQMFISLDSSIDKRSAIYISGKALVDWRPLEKEELVVFKCSQNGGDLSFTSPYTLGSVLSALRDPLNPWFELVGVPDRVTTSNGTLVFKFQLPKGYSGEGYRCVVDKSTLLPMSLTRSGQGMPDLTVSYRFAPLIGKVPRLGYGKSAVKKSCPSVGVAFERSRFRPLYEGAYVGPK